MQNEPSLSVAEKTNQDILGFLYNQTLSMTIFHICAALVIALWLLPVTIFTELLIWAACVCVVSLSRIGFQQIYQRKHNQQNYKLWMHAWAGLSAITASIFASGLIYLTPIQSIEYMVSIGLFVLLLSAIAVIAYSSSIYAVLSFVLPLTVPPVCYLLMQNNPSSLIVGFIIVGFGITALFYLKSNQETFKKSIVSHILHKQEGEKRKLIEKQLQDVSRRDGLTGLFNRRYFDEVLEIEIGRARRNHTSLCLVMLEIDFFPEFNEHYGHIAGDSCIITIAEIAEALANRQGDLISRYSNEVFTIILPNIDIKGAVAFASKLQEQVQRRKLPHVGSKLTSLKTVTISAGVTNLLPFAVVTPSEVIEDADSALFEAKRQGRNRVHCNDKHGLGQSH